MEDVLDVYEQAYDPAHPVVCFDENSVVLHADVRPTLPVAPGCPSGLTPNTNAKALLTCSFWWNRCAAASASLAVSLHTQARLLVEYGRDRDWDLPAVLPPTKVRRRTAIQPAGGRPSSGAQCEALYDLLAIYRWGCAGQSPAPLPQKLTELTTNGQFT